MQTARIKALFALLIFATVGLSGCALSTMTPVEPLEKNESVSSVVLDWPGYFVAPRLAGQYTHGLGNGDITGRLTTSGYSAGFGLSRRWYAADWLHLELQGDFRAGFNDLNIGEIEPFAYLTPRAIAYQSGGDVNFYGGWDAALVLVDEWTNTSGLQILTGPVLGVDIALGDSGAIQIEVAGRPLFYSPSEGFEFNRGLDDGHDGAQLGAMPQLGIGYKFE